MACCFASNEGDSAASGSDEGEEIEVENLCCLAKVKDNLEDELIIKTIYDALPDVEPGDVFRYAAKYLEEGSERDCLHDVFTGDTYTYTEANDVINIIAQNLYQHYGFRQGDHFAFYTLNHIDYVLLLLAVWKLKGVYVGINPQLKPDEVRRELMLTECRLLYAHKMTAKGAVEAVSGTQVKTIFVGTEEEVEDGCTKFSVLTQEPAVRVPLPPEPAADEDVCAVMFSSGTTGLPKAVEITHANLKNSERAPSIYNVCPHRVMYQPMFHIFGCVVVLLNFRHHETIHLMSHFDLQVYLECISKYRVNNLILVPPVAVLLVKTELGPSVDLSCVDTVYSSAAPLHKEVCEGLNKKLGGNVYFIQLYGLTETSALAVCTPGKDNPWGGDKCPAGCIGLPVIGCEAKIISLETQRTLRRGKKGELCLRGTLIMKGYLKDPQATRKAIDENGWFHTGDYGYADENGYIFVMDRIVDLIRCKGKKIAPTELEALLLSHEAIADAGVIGVPDDEHGAVPYAWVVLHPDQTLTEKELQTWVAGQVPSYKQLRGGVKFVPFVPKSPAGKILHREIKQVTMDAKKQQ